MTDKDFWLIVRRALLMIVKAIEKKYQEEQIIDTEASSVSWILDK